MFARPDFITSVWLVIVLSTTIWLHHCHLPVSIWLLHSHSWLLCILSIWHHHGLLRLLWCRHAICWLGHGHLSRKRLWLHGLWLHRLLVIHRHCQHGRLLHAHAHHLWLLWCHAWLNRILWHLWCRLHHLVRVRIGHRYGWLSYIAHTHGKWIWSVHTSTRMRRWHTRHCL